MSDIEFSLLDTSAKLGRSSGFHSQPIILVEPVIG